MIQKFNNWLDCLTETSYAQTIWGIEPAPDFNKWYPNDKPCPGFIESFIQIFTDLYDVLILGKGW